MGLLVRIDGVPKDLFEIRYGECRGIIDFLWTFEKKGINDCINGYFNGFCDFYEFSDNQNLKSTQMQFQIIQTKTNKAV